MTGRSMRGLPGLRAAVATAALAATALTSLTPLTAAATPEPPQRLLVWINGDKGYNGLQRIGDAFSRVSGVPVVVQHPEGAPDKFQAAAGAGKGPDIFCWPHDRVGEWAKSGLIVPLRPSKAVREAIEPAAWQAFSWRGKVWGYPLSFEAIGLIVNRRLVEVPPARFEDLPALDAQLKARGARAILWDYNKSFFSWPMLAAAGGQIFGQGAGGEYDTSQVGVNNDGALAGATLLRQLIDGGTLPRGARYSDMESQFAAGKVAMMISGPWAWDNARKSGIDFMVAPIPSVQGRPAQPFVGVLGCMVTAPSRQKDIAREFLEQHVLSLQGLKTIAADVPLGTPANKAYYAELAADPLIRATMANVRAGRAIPNIPEVGRFWPALDAALEALTQGRQTPKEALDGAAARMLAK